MHNLPVTTRGEENFSDYESFAAYLETLKGELETCYITPKLMETRTRQDMDDEMELGMMLNLFEDKKLALEIERFIKRERVISGATLLQNYHHLVVVGGRGTGKTTLLKYLALRCHEENIEKKARGMVPILLPLGVLIKNNGQSLIAGINAVTAHVGEKILQSGKCVLLLDGFEQLLTTENRQRVAKEILGLAHDYRECAIIVTAMESDYLNELPGFHKLTLLGFNEKQIKQFLNNWFDVSRSDDVRGMVSLLNKNASLGQLARNPLMMTMLATIYERDKTLPTKRTELYGQISEIALPGWKNLQNQEHTYFFNASWQDYFTALKLKQSETSLNVILTHLDEPNWAGVILFYAGLMGDATLLVQGILNRVNEDNYYMAYILAGKCIGEAGWVDSQLVDTITTELWSLYQDDVVLEALGSPIEVLAGIKPAGLIDELIGQLKDKDHEIRSHAAHVLESLGGARAVPVLLDVLAHDKDGYTRGVAATALGSLGKREQVVPVLIKTLQKDKNRYARAGAIEAFRSLTCIEAIPVLMDKLKTDKNDYVRSGAADALGTIGVGDVIPVLAEALAHDASIDVRMSAAEALGALGDGKALSALTEALKNDADWQVRVRVIGALEELGYEDAIPILAEALKHDKDWKVRVNSIAGLCVLGCVAAVPALVEALQWDHHGFVRYRAAKALGKIGDERAIPILKKAMTVKGTGVDKFIKKAAQQSFEKISFRLREENWIE